MAYPSSPPDDLREFRRRREPNRRARRQHLQGRRHWSAEPRKRPPPKYDDGKPIGELLAACDCYRCRRRRAAPVLSPHVGEDGQWPGPHVGSSGRSYDCHQLALAPRPKGEGLWSKAEDRAHVRGEPPPAQIPAPPGDDPGEDKGEAPPPPPGVLEATVSGAAERGVIPQPQAIQRNRADERDARAARRKAEAEGWREQPDGKWVRAE